MTQAPSHADQIVFLTRVQKVLDEGQFVATYKFALLIALIDIAIERGDDSGAPLDVELAWLAEKFIELYWNHSKPFGGAVLSQNKGSNIAVLKRIQALQARTMSLAEARRAPQWRPTLRGIGQIIQAMPLFRLQLLRGDQRLPFLYEEQLVSGTIRLKPGVVYCLRKFSTLIGALARNGWLREVRDNPRNAYAMGVTQSLETFLFGDERVPLGASGMCSFRHRTGGASTAAAGWRTPCKSTILCLGRCTRRTLVTTSSSPTGAATRTSPIFSRMCPTSAGGACATKLRGSSLPRPSWRMAYLPTLTQAVGSPAGPTSGQRRRTR